MDQPLITRPFAGTWNASRYQYFLVVCPDGQAAENILKEQQYFARQFLQKDPRVTPAYITVADFFATEAMEETLIRYVQRICSYSKSFNVSLNNFSGFPPNTVYLRVQDSRPFIKLGKQLAQVNNYIQSCACPPIELSLHPHISIASQLPEKLYLQALLEFGQRTFFETFTATELVLLRKTAAYDNGRIINRFHLQPATGMVLN